MKIVIKVALFLLGFVFCSLAWGMEAQAGEKENNGFSYIEDWLSTCDLGQINKGMDSLFPGIHDPIFPHPGRSVFV